MTDNRVIIEFRPVGPFVKVSAVDPVTLEEVSIVGDPRQGEETLKAIAVRKLRYVQAQQRRTKPAPGGGFSV